MTLSLFSIIHSSDVATNRMTDFYHTSAVENKNFKSKNDVKGNNSKDNVLVSKKIIPHKEENKKLESKFVVKNIMKLQKKSKKSTTSIKKNKKIANIIRTQGIEQERKKIPYDLKNYECIDVLCGDATFYTAEPGKRMANGKIPIAGVHCAMHSRFRGSLVKITFSNGKTIWLIVGDGGGALENGSAIVDIFCNTREECIKNGRKKVKVEVWRKKK